MGGGLSAGNPVTGGTARVSVIHMSTSFCVKKSYVELGTDCSPLPTFLIRQNILGMFVKCYFSTCERYNKLVNTTGILAVSAAFSCNFCAVAAKWTNFVHNFTFSLLLIFFCFLLGSLCCTAAILFE